MLAVTKFEEVPVISLSIWMFPGRGLVLTTDPITSVAESATKSLLPAGALFPTGARLPPLPPPPHEPVLKTANIKATRRIPLLSA
jgi:hypothetical protein